MNCCICHPVAELARENKRMEPRHLWAYGYASALETLLFSRGYPLCPECKGFLDKLLETRGIRIVPTVPEVATRDASS